MIDDFIIETSDSVAVQNQCNDWDTYYLYFQGNKKRSFTNTSWRCTYKKMHKSLITFPPFIPRIEWQINATYVFGIETVAFNPLCLIHYLVWWTHQ